MAFSDILLALTRKLSSGSQCLQDEDDPAFKESMSRWSDFGVQTPYAILQPETEADVVIIVQDLTAASIPFVPSCGGHSPYSSIGRDGVVVDLSRFTGVEVNETLGLASVYGGTLMKELQTELHKHVRFTAVGSGGTVGVIPFFIGGGLSTYRPFTGYACENIVSASIVMANGQLLHASENEHPDLLWAIRGAGQFVGIVTQITISTYPYSLLGNSEGQRMIGMYAFTTDKVDGVCAAVLSLMRSKVLSAGHFSVTLAPPDFRHLVLLVAPQIFASAAEASAICQPLLDLEPLQQMLVPSTFETHSDHMDYLCAKGSYKRFEHIGMNELTAERFQRLIDLHSELRNTCPDAAKSALSVEWHSSCEKAHQDNAFGLPNTEVWLNVLGWYDNAESHIAVERFNQRAQAIARDGLQVEDFVTYANTGRVDPVSWRYKGEDRIAKLRAVKERWDPSGVFTKQFL